MTALSLRRVIFACLYQLPVKLFMLPMVPAAGTVEYC